MKRKAITSALLMSLLVAACTASVSDSADQLCSSLEALQGTMEQIAGADANPDSTTIESVQDAAQEVESAVEEVQSAEVDLSDSLKSELQENFDELQSSIQGISEDMTLTEAGQAVASALTTFRQSWDQTLSELNCSADT